MFERLADRVRRVADRSVAKRTQSLAERIGTQLPAGISAMPETSGIVLSGRRLKRRFALDLKLSWLVLEAAQDEGARPK